MTRPPGYAAGVRVEHAVIHHLRDQGYEVTRAASSKGASDVIAIKDGQVLLISVKRTTMPGPGERAQLLSVAALLPDVAVPLVALGPVARLQFRELVGLGPNQWVPWAPDYTDSPDDAACPEHRPVQHRDGKAPWCKRCGLDAGGNVPTSRFDGPDAA